MRANDAYVPAGADEAEWEVYLAKHREALMAERERLKTLLRATEGGYRLVIAGYFTYWRVDDRSRVE